MELRERASELSGLSVDTIYFGGGTPSLLQPDQVKQLLRTMRDHFSLSPNLQVSLEANPDDLNKDLIDEWISVGIDRMSIGIQSFYDDQLKIMNRRHDAEQAHRVIQQATNKGKLEVSIDLIYGLPGLKPEEWEETLMRVNTYPIHHISAYHLTYEKGTPIYNLLKSGSLSEIREDESWKQFSLLIDVLKQGKFEQYEISNFARGGKYSRHNLKYWTGMPYVGVGPSAHSYDGMTRKWNQPNLAAYLRSWGDQKTHPESSFVKQERLDDIMIRNEFIMTRLRTRWGISIEEWRILTGDEGVERLSNKTKSFIISGDMMFQENAWRLTPQGMFRSDGIMASLFEDSGEAD